MKLFATLTVAFLALSALASFAPTAAAIPSPVCVAGDAECDANEVACVLYPVEACVMNPSEDVTVASIPSPVCGPVGESCDVHEVACVLYPVKVCVMDPCPMSGCFPAAGRNVAVPLLP